MRLPELKVPEQVHAKIQDVYFQDIKRHVQNNEKRMNLKTVSRMPSSPALTRKKLEENPAAKPQAKPQEKPQTPPPEKKKTILEEQLAKQYEEVKAHRSMSTGRLFDNNTKQKKIQESKSDPLKPTKK